MQVTWESGGKPISSGCRSHLVTILRCDSTGLTQKGRQASHKLHVANYVHHMFFKGTKSAQVCMTRDSESIPAVGFKLVQITFIKQRWRYNFEPKSKHNQLTIHREDILTITLSVLWSHTAASPGRVRKVISAHQGFSLHVVWMELSQDIPLWTWSRGLLSMTAWIHHPLSQGQISKKPWSVTELCSNCFGHAHRHTYSTGTFYFLIPEGIMQHTYSSHSSRES